MAIMRRGTPKVQIKEEYAASLQTLHFPFPKKRAYIPAENLAATKPSFLSVKQGPAADWLMGGSSSLWKAAARGELRPQFERELAATASHKGLSTEAVSPGHGPAPAQQWAVCPLAILGVPHCGSAF